MVREYPLDMYQKAEKRIHSSQVKMPTVKSMLKEGKDTFVGIGFTHDTDNFNYGVKCSNYKLLATMMDKVSHQMLLAEKIRAVDASDMLVLLLKGISFVI
jgi:DNA polymerase II large subunit